jgi:hypothetical protein
MKLHELLSAASIGSAIERMLDVTRMTQMGINSKALKTRSRTPGRPQPAGAKLARKARDREIGKGHPR